MSEENGLADGTEEIVAIKREMLARSAKRVPLITASKLSRVCFCRICACGEPERVVTDDMEAARSFFSPEQLG